MKYGIVGLGVVGKGIDEGSKLPAFAVYDMVPSKCRNLEKFSETKGCFVSVPTPTIEGTQDLRPMESALLWLDEIDYAGIVIIKSTVLPGSCRKLETRFRNLKIVHSPEFLIARSAAADFKNQRDILISGEHKNVFLAIDVYEEILSNKSNFQVSPHFEVTEWAKYIHNCALPVILSFLNECHELIAIQEMFDEAVNLAFLQGNLPKCHKVPGPDGERGWGGMCFTKDTLAMLDFAKKHCVEMPTLEGAVNKNKLIRPEDYGLKEECEVTPYLPGL